MTAAEAERIFALLSDGGQVFMPMAETFFAVRFAMLRDKFGVLDDLARSRRTPEQMQVTVVALLARDQVV